MKAVTDFFIGEWYFAVPLVVMSLVSAALVIWRLLLNNSAKTDLDDFLPDFQETLRKRGIPGAIELCREEKGLIPSRLYVAGLEAADQGAAAMRRSMAAETELEIVPRLNFLLPMILAIAKIATMVGLFFTVISMINTFNAIGEAANKGGAKDVGGHSSKIGLALFATALGLFTAIPLVFSHVLFKAWIAGFELKTKAAAAKLVTLVTNYKKDPNLLAPPKKREDEEEPGDDRPARAGAGGRAVASAPKALDVWFVAANTVYRQVPYQVVADWVREGRLGTADQLRPAGAADRDWRTVGGWDLFADYLPRPAAATSAEGGEVELPEPVEPESPGRKKREAEDDEVDMIPLIDISMVLLVFFIIISATGALSPVDVPDMRYAGELTNDPDALTISIQKASEENVYYSVRVGKIAPRPENDKLPNPEAALAALDTLLAEATRPPHVMVACEQKLPSARVIELQLELKKRLDKRLINSFDATVNEAPPK